ncbi:DUF4105 domain-containing protein [Flavobacterium sp. TMP13]|uniref:lipoprotein N-acyltransferase Lnb domain-containing protein n=1 Tax=Flavobacterium sp. TMP13 TaxID=3425950 RepID=UPI003D77CA4C
MSFYSGFSQNIALTDQAKISVLTCGTGNESYSLFGHTAIRVQDSIHALDVVYNYGAFDFRTPNFVAKFAKGNLQYFAIANSFSDFLSNYTDEKRSVYEQQLEINSAEKQQIFDNLNHTLLSNERFYTYKFIDKNCTSMVVDLINKSLGSTVIVKKGDLETTYRSVLFPYFEGHFYERLGTSIIFGMKVDEKATRIFLPFELKSSLAKTNYKNEKLAGKSEVLLSFEKEVNTSMWNNWYTYLVILALILVLNKKAIDFTYLTGMGLLGVFFIVMGFYSDHQELAFNYNVLLFSPIVLILIVFAIFHKRSLVYKTVLLQIVILLIYGIFIASKAHFIIVLPLLLTTLIILVRIAVRNAKRIPIII